MEISLLSSLLYVLITLGAAQSTFTIQGSSSEAAPGSPYTFTCVQSGTLPDTAGQGIAFVKNGAQTSCSTFRTPCSPSFTPGVPCGCVDSSGETYTYRYNISSVGMEHSGSWKCRIPTSVPGTNIDTDLFHLTVPVRPTVMPVNNSQVTVREGQSVTLACEATGSPAPSFSWSRSGTPVSSGSQSSLTFTPDRRDGNSQTVTCTASNSAGNYSASFSLNVMYPPEGDPIISIPSQVTEGRDVILTCRVTGGNPPVSNVTLTCPGGHTNTESGSPGRLQFTADRRDQGSCVCSASHVLGYTRTASVNITVHSSSNTGSASSNMESEPSNLGPLVGGVVGGLMGLVVLVVIVVFLFKKRKKLERSNQTLSRASLDDKLADEELGNAKNSSGGVVHPIFDDNAEAMDSHGPVANAGRRKKGNMERSSKQSNGELYAHVNKSSTEKGDVYQNAPVKGRKSADKARANVMARQDNQQRRSIHDGGCVYMKVETTGNPTSPPKSKKPQSPSQDDAVVYTVIDHSKKGPTLADEEDTEKK